MIDTPLTHEEYALASTEAYRALLDRYVGDREGMTVAEAIGLPRMLGEPFNLEEPLPEGILSLFNEKALYYLHSGCLSRLSGLTSPNALELRQEELSNPEGLTSYQKRLNNLIENERLLRLAIRLYAA